MKTCILDLLQFEQVHCSLFFLCLFFVSVTLKYFFSGEVGMRLKAFSSKSNTEHCVTKIHQ